MAMLIEPGGLLLCTHPKRGRRVGIFPKIISN